MAKQVFFTPWLCANILKIRGSCGVKSSNLPAINPWTSDGEEKKKVVTKGFDKNSFHRPDKIQAQLRED